MSRVSKIKMASAECQQKEDSCEGKHRSTLYEKSLMTISEDSCKSNSQTNKIGRGATSSERISDQRKLCQYWRKKGIG